MSNDETEETSEGGGEAETSVAEQAKKVAANPWVVLAVALLVGGGSGSAAGLIGTQNGDAAATAECHRMVRDLNEDRAKALAEHSREDERRWASTTDVAVLGQKIDALREQVGEMREEMRSARPGRRQPPG